MAVRADILRVAHIHLRDDNDRERAHHSHVHVRTLAAHLPAHVRQEVLVGLLARPQDHHTHLGGERLPRPALLVHLGRVLRVPGVCRVQDVRHLRTLQDSNDLRHTAERSVLVHHTHDAHIHHVRFYRRHAVEVTVEACGRQRRRQLRPARQPERVVAEKERPLGQGLLLARQGKQKVVRFGVFIHSQHGHDRLAHKRMQRERELELDVLLEHELEQPREYKQRQRAHFSAECAQYSQICFGHAARQVGECERAEC